MEQQTKKHPDEINLYDLWKVIIKRKKIIIGVFLFFVIAATIIGFLQPKIYRGDAILIMQQATNITAKEITDIVGNIDKDKKTNILPKTYASIADIKLNTLKDSKDKIEVVIESKNINVISESLSEIIEYINNIDLVKLNVKEEQDRLMERSSELSSVIEASSELLHAYSSLLKVGKLVPVGFNPVELNKKISDIKMEKLMTDQALQRLKGGVAIAKQLYVRQRPVKPKRMMTVVLSGVISLFLGIFLSFFGEYVERLNYRNKAL